MKTNDGSSEPDVEIQDTEGCLVYEQGRFGTARVEPLNPWEFNPTRPTRSQVYIRGGRQGHCPRDFPHSDKPRRLTISVFVLYDRGYFEAYGNLSSEQQDTIGWRPLDRYTP